ncbi:ATP-dependent Clp protease proteolytic subunit-related protein [Drosera capensis]
MLPQSLSQAFPLTDARDTPNPNFSVDIRLFHGGFHFLPATPQLPSPTPRHRPLPPSAISPSPSSLSLNCGSSFLGGSFSGEELKLSRRTKCGDNCLRGDVFLTMAIVDDEFDLSGRNAPPNMPSVVLNERIIYIGKPLTFKVAESIFAQLFCLWERSLDKPISMCINSTGSTTGKPKKGRQRDAFALYDLMTYHPCAFYFCIC